MKVDSLGTLGCKEQHHSEYLFFVFVCLFVYLMYLQLGTGEPATWKCQQVQTKMPQEKASLAEGPRRKGQTSKIGNF